MSLMARHVFYMNSKLGNYMVNWDLFWSCEFSYSDDVNINWKKGLSFSCFLGPLFVHLVRSVSEIIRRCDDPYRFVVSCVGLSACL